MFKHIKNDLPASIVVFFVALPLCLGIALASGAPLFSGIIAGIVGGIVVGLASGSVYGVSGPAAGLAVIVLNSIDTLGSWPVFLVAVVLAGVFQVLMGFAKAGIIAYFFPSPVIKGMLSGIGLLIIIKQIPFAIGLLKDAQGAQSLMNISSDTITPGALLIGITSLGMLILWDKVLTKKHKIFQLIQGPIAVIIFGVLTSYLYTKGFLGLSLSPEQIVTIPVPDSLSGFLSQFTMPDFSAVTNFEVWKVAVVIAIVASLETLLCVEATDKIDPDKNITPTNRELKAQGLGNIISGLIGGLPVTQVIVRSSANINFGAKTKLSGILHGVFLLISVITISGLLNMIPLASLAAILLIVGYKLAKPALIKKMFLLGPDQFIPFCATVIGIVATDLLSGLAIGMVFGIFFTLKESYMNSHQVEEVTFCEDGHEIHHITLAEEVTFLNKISIMKTLKNIPKNSEVIIDHIRNKTLTHDVVEVLEDFSINALSKNIKIKVINNN